MRTCHVTDGLNWKWSVALSCKESPTGRKAKTVTSQEWEKWIADNSVLEDIDLLKELDMPDLIPAKSFLQSA